MRDPRALFRLAAHIEQIEANPPDFDGAAEAASEIVRQINRGHVPTAYDQTNQPKNLTVEGQ